MSWQHLMGRLFHATRRAAWWGALGASFLVAAATILLWMRSSDVADSLSLMLTRHPAPQWRFWSAQVMSRQGRLLFELEHRAFDLTSRPQSQWPRHRYIDASWSTWAPPGGPAVSGPWWPRAGFALNHRPMAHTGSTSAEYWTLAAPCWFPLILAAVVPARAGVLVWRLRRRRRWIRQGRCEACGYDLRGGHDRCPECGLPLPKAGALPGSPGATWRTLLRGRRLGVALPVAAALAVLVGLGLWRQARAFYWQRQCMHYTASPDTVVYEEEPQAASALLTRPGYQPYTVRGQDVSGVVRLDPPEPEPRTAAAHVPECWRQLAARIGRGTLVRGGTLFLHELTAPTGQRFLAIVQYWPAFETPEPIHGHNTDQIVLLPATLLRGPQPYNEGVMLQVPMNFPRRPPQTRFYAGQPDPADPSHFTIRYEMWGQQDILDGRINNSGRVTLTPRRRPRSPS